MLVVSSRSLRLWVQQDSGPTPTSAEPVCRWGSSSDVRSFTTVISQLRFFAGPHSDFYRLPFVIGTFINAGDRWLWYLLVNLYLGRSRTGFCSHIWPDATAVCSWKSSRHCRKWHDTDTNLRMTNDCPDWAISSDIIFSYISIRWTRFEIYIKKHRTRVYIRNIFKYLFNRTHCASIFIICWAIFFLISKCM